MIHGDHLEKVSSSSLFPCLPHHIHISTDLIMGSFRQEVKGKKLFLISLITFFKLYRNPPDGHNSKCSIFFLFFFGAHERYIKSCVCGNSSWTLNHWTDLKKQNEFILKHHFVPCDVMVFVLCTETIDRFVVPSNQFTSPSFTCKCSQWSCLFLMKKIILLG